MKETTPVETTVIEITVDIKENQKPELVYKIKEMEFPDGVKRYLPIAINSNGDTYLVNKEGTALSKQRESTILHYEDSPEDATRRLVTYYKLQNKPKLNDKYIDVDIKAEVEKANQNTPQKIDYDSIEYLTSLPQVWGLKGGTTYYYVSSCSNPTKYVPVPKNGEIYCRGLCDRNSLTTEKQAEQIRALSQLLVMRDEYNNGWIPDWCDDKQKKYCIYLSENKLSVGVVYYNNRVLAFPTEALRNLFLVTFRNLIAEAGDLIS